MSSASPRLPVFTFSTFNSKWRAFSLFRTDVTSSFKAFRLQFLSKIASASNVARFAEEMPFQSFDACFVEVVMFSKAFIPLSRRAWFAKLTVRTSMFNPGVVWSQP